MMDFPQAFEFIAQTYPDKKAHHPKCSYRQAGMLCDCSIIWAEYYKRKSAALEALLNTPEVADFDKAVPLEAAHQVLRWGAEKDAGKNPEDWFWLVGYLAGKALSAQKTGNTEKAKHHCVSTAAALRNWHAHVRSGESEMRPGISAEKQMSIDSEATS